MENDFYCIDCRETKPIAKEGGTGYATLADGSKVCYACAGLRDARKLRETGKLVGYLTIDSPASRTDMEARRTLRKINARYTGNSGTFSNWPGTFKVKTGSIAYSRNNFGADRLDFWFSWEGARYWGVNVGDSQLARVRRVKSK